MDEKTNKFNQTVANIEDAQTELRLLIKDAFLYGWTKDAVNKRIIKIINQVTKGVKIERLKQDIEKSLWNFANKQRIIWQNSALSPAIMAAVILAVNGKSTAPAERKFTPIDAARFESLTYEQRQKGVPLREFYGEVWKTKVKPTLDSLCRANALDPNDFRGRNSLRNLAEMETRYQDHQDNVQSLRERGAKLVICSAHADCSKRCAKYQGRVYSMDGTEGYTSDGRHYVPLEEATNNPDDLYGPTKAGRYYQNGLLGFNCRHKLYKFHGQAAPFVNEADRKREYDITKKQRQLEREVRAAKTEALMNKGVNDKYAKAMRKKARELYGKYIAFCQENKRAYYPMKVAI